MATKKMHPFWWFTSPPIYCPSGEQIVNGGFETGDETGWFLDDGEISTEYVHSGTYSCMIMPTGARLLSQVLTTPVNTLCVDTFEFWARQGSSNIITARVVYTDDNYSDLAKKGTYDWQLFDIKTILIAGKVIKELRIINGYISNAYIDDVTLIASGEVI